MTRPLLVLRPEPGNAATVARITALGATAIALPLFDIVALAWSPGVPGHDALLFTSANAVRFGGDALAGLRHLPVLAVGAATARAARAAGFDVVMTGTSDAATLIAQAQAAGIRRALHLGGRDTGIAEGGIVARSIAVYASECRPVDRARWATLTGTVALLHSARAAARLADLVDGAGAVRRDFAVAAISPAVAVAAGSGWRKVAVASTPDDDALIAAAMAIAPD